MSITATGVARQSLAARLAVRYSSRVLVRMLLWLLLGFFLLPITTVVYAWLVSAHRPLEGVNLILLIIAVVLDAGSHNGGRQYYRNR